MKINQYIDHTLLKADANEQAILKIINEARQYQFASVCINPIWVSYAAEQLKNSPVKVCTVIGFPLGENTSETKAYEAKNAVINGANEVDMVINIGALKTGHERAVQKDIEAVVEAVASKAVVKVIIETALLSEAEKIKACQLAVSAGADFVKTSTGFSTGGATLADVKLMKATVGNNAQVKASGGIYSLADAEAMIAAGATRIGTSAGVAIMKGQVSDAAY
ncbi:MULTISPECIES: deoxyribose-phosphate aldolase [unclassified Enterococcus]|uniref:deoxyribose-phosphate aldolase n=1 Tax=unclassified Enterococcus TaxID=2608891 RepID=UPI0015529E26|nr:MULTISPECIES: deoxyribose-phosphate aldolase [unclassified Enterococcus]MBS7576140.1 deoxyribose-phosphate aldolase [Enterococcus sp. MMGLQ5-2]MBS7583373.1 deoxyribose-phosphate aldolase [Enterococcus sp. MMGLQ5-1]NPD11233.1 deoxyribose-phosphate aldolase [Enterococcus sp. MMGLQ5-1]NPD35976.1 deoxyribose-phosphate aldolase [Enterococcus sp. MMGLQ5-2]